MVAGRRAAGTLASKSVRLRPAITARITSPASVRTTDSGGERGASAGVAGSAKTVPCGQGKTRQELGNRDAFAAGLLQFLDDQGVAAIRPAGDGKTFAVGSAYRSGWLRPRR